MHFTALSSNHESDSDVDGIDEGIVDEEALAQNSSIDKTESNTAHIGNGFVSDLECSSVAEDDTSMLEMILIKDVSSGVEVMKFLSVMWFFFASIGK